MRSAKHSVYLHRRMCLTMQKSPNFNNVRLGHRRQLIIGGLLICAFYGCLAIPCMGIEGGPLSLWQLLVIVSSYNITNMGVLLNIIKYDLKIHSPKEVYVLFRELKYNRFSLPDKVERRLRLAAGKHLKSLYKKELNRYVSWLAKHENETDENKKIRIFDKNDIKEPPIIKKKLRLKYNMKGLNKRDYKPDINPVAKTFTHESRNQWVTIIYTPMGGQNKKY